jgi:hypothetical protein
LDEKRARNYDSPMRLRLPLTALACLPVLGGCGGDDSPEPRASALDETIYVLQDGQPAETCALLTERLVLDSYGAMGERGRRRCVADADVLPPGRNVEVLEQSQAQAVVEMVAEGESGFMSLIPVNGRWLVDGVAIDRSELPGPRPQVAESVSRAALEGYLRDELQFTAASCSELIETGVGEWRCDLQPRDGGSQEQLFEISPDGGISGVGNTGGSGIAACCMTLEPESG